MSSLTPIRQVTALVAAVAVLAASLPIRDLQAAMVSTEQALESETASVAERDRVAHFLQRADVANQLVAWGIDPKEAGARLASLSDQEVAEIAGQLDQLPAGEGFLETAIVAGLFVFVLLLVTDILGFTDVYDFVKKPARR